MKDWRGTFCDYCKVEIKEHESCLRFRKLGASGSVESRDFMHFHHDTSKRPNTCWHKALESGVFKI